MLIFHNVSLRPNRSSSRRRMIRAVLFDLDGVVVDTIHYHYLAWDHMFRELGGSVSKESVLLHEGRASREILPLFLREAGVELDEERHAEFIERKREYYRSIVKIKYFPDIFSTIGTLKSRGFRTALVTASARGNMEKSLDESMREYFDFIITGDEVRRAKPAPEPYLAAAERLHVPPPQCLVVENAPLGILSALNAGMTCVAVETTLSAEHLRAAHAIIHEARMLLDLPMLALASPETANGKSE